MEKDGEGLAPETVALYLKDEDEWALLHAVIKAADRENGKESVGLYAISFFPEYFLSDLNFTNRQLKLFL